MDEIPKINKKDYFYKRHTWEWLFQRINAKPYTMEKTKERLEKLDASRDIVSVHTV
ncbi:hypothetical protein KIN20_007199 [Parelaphostrongylus tenuis]|uniref:Uncharacterized protein n=1 Tax=Parelaphostrongylus tenuis TaxID=148309 RepID=A0AAD5MV80_PARTN|nr:hypothetical protein KIN20_007199 [Parelaphostrongylus tenuis]